jgi:hypothetical protein
VLKLVVRTATIVAKACFWLVCFHYFGSANLLFVAAAWTFILAIKDLTFMRIRLSGGFADPERFRGTLLKSVAAEAVLLALRLGLALLFLPVLRIFHATTAAMFTTLLVGMIFWSKETLIALASAFKVGRWRRYVLLLGNTGALAGIVLLAELDVGAVVAASTALVLREAIVFTGSLVIVLAGAWLDSSRRPDEEDEEEEDDDDGSVARVLDSDGNPVRSATKVLIADNYVYSRWRMVQFWTRTAAHGAFGPFGSIAARFFFTYRKPGPYRHRDARSPLGRVLLIAAGVAVAAAVLAYLAERAGVLHALGIVAAAFGLRVVAQSLNLLLWRRLSPLVGSKVKVRLPGLRHLRRQRRRDDDAG